jgi:hypothetical protein
LRASILRTMCRSVLTHSNCNSCNSCNCTASQRWRGTASAHARAWAGVVAWGMFVLWLWLWLWRLLFVGLSVEVMELLESPPMLWVLVRLQTCERLGGEGSGLG